LWDFQKIPVSKRGKKKGKKSWKGVGPIDKEKYPQRRGGLSGKKKALLKTFLLPKKAKGRRGTAPDKVSGKLFLYQSTLI